MLQNAIDRARRVRRSGQAGFTLIELLIVIVILGVLAGIVVFSVKGITNKGDAAACNSEVSTVDTAEEASYANGDGYQANVSALVGKYLHSMPKYIATYNVTTQKVNLDGPTTAPAGCNAA